VLESLILESIKDDAIKKFIKSTGRGIAAVQITQELVNKFWNEIRQKESDPKKKDINYWLEQGFEAFKEYIDNFKSKKQEKRSNKNLTSVDNGNGKLLEVVDGYELWKVDSYEAAKFLGRDYKNMPSKWCISSDNKDHWEKYYKIKNTRFFFLISKTMHDSGHEKAWNKIAIQVFKNYKYAYFWNLYDDNIMYGELPDNIQQTIDKIENKIVWYKITLNNNEKLISAIYDNDLNDIKDAITAGADLSYNDNEVFKVAIEQYEVTKNINVIKYLVEQGIDIHFDNEWALITAIEINHSLDLVKYLIEQGANITSEVLIAAINIENLQTVQYLVEHDTNITTNITANKNDALFRAVLTNNEEIVEYLLKHGANTEDNNNILYGACLRKQYSIIKLLIDHGTKIPDYICQTVLSKDIIDFLNKNT